MNTRARVTFVPALLAAGALASLPGVLRAAAQESSPVAGAADVPAAWSDLGLPRLDLTVTPDGVEGVPESAPAGRYLLTVSGAPASDDGPPAGVLFLQLPDGMTMDDAMAQAGGAQDGPPDFYYDAIIPGGMPPTSAGIGVSIIDVTPGDWVIAGSQLSTPPVFLTATGEMPADAVEPESNVGVSLAEMSIEIDDGAFIAGQNLVRISNDGGQPHFIEVMKLPDGSTNDNVAATLQSESGTPVAGALDMSAIEPVVATGDQSSGTTSWVAFNLESGTYAALCFFPDRESGVPHAYMGMHTVFEVA